MSVLEIDTLISPSGNYKQVYYKDKDTWEEYYLTTTDTWEPQGGGSGYFPGFDNTDPEWSW
jgi:hypothetical protein